MVAGQEMDTNISRERMTELQKKFREFMGMDTKQTIETAFACASEELQTVDFGEFARALMNEEPSRIIDTCIALGREAEHRGIGTIEWVHYDGCGDPHPISRLDLVMLCIDELSEEGRIKDMLDGTLVPAEGIWTPYLERLPEYTGGDSDDGQ